MRSPCLLAVARAVLRGAQITLAACCISACAPALQHAKPDIGPVPPGLAAALANAEGSVHSATTPAPDAHRVHWQAYFKDERLKALLAAALAHNRDLRSAVARVEEARGQWALVRAERWPLLQIGAQARLDQAYAEGLSYGPQRRLDFGANVASFELDFFGRLASLSSAARANFLATEEARRAAEMALVGQIAELYHAQRQADELALRAQSSATSRERSLHIVTQARDIGMAHELELENARMQLAAAQSQVAQLKHVQQQVDSLLRLLLVHLPQDLPPGLPLAELAASYAVPFNLSADVLLLRPDVASAEHRLRGAQASVEAARAAFFPRVALTASAGLASGGLSNLFKAGAWSFMPSISLPLFDGGRTQAAFDIAKARELMVVAQYERAIQSAFREVADQLSTRESVRAQLNAAEISLAAQRARLNIQTLRHQAGMSGLLEVLDAQRELVAAEQSHLVVFRAQLDTAVGLYRALGGGAPVPAGTATTTKPHGS